MNRFVVVGGGIAGTTCAITIKQSRPDASVVLISNTIILKNAVNIRKIAKAVEEFDVVLENDTSFLIERGIDFIEAFVTGIDAHRKILLLNDGRELGFERLCLCTGGVPKIISHEPNVIGIRDTHSVNDLCRRLRSARTVLIVGNGGIALELVLSLRPTLVCRGAIKSCFVVWSIKDNYIGNTFFDEKASTFLIPHLFDGHQDACTDGQDCGMQKALTEEQPESHGDGKTHQPSPYRGGASAGPGWTNIVSSEIQSPPHITSSQLQIEFQTQVESIKLATGGEFPMEVLLSNKKTILCDFVVSATGVSPNTDFLAEQFKKDIDGGVVVDRNMMTNIKDIYAAGDVASVSWPDSPHWFQMRLWSQARQMGRYAGWCMTESDEKDIDFSFEIFTHVTRFFGHRVVLLGNFNGQNLPKDEIEVLYRVTLGERFVKVIIHNNRIKGSMLIGETDLEETFENLILDGIDIGRIKSHLLDPDFDVEDYFD